MLEILINFYFSRSISAVGGSQSIFSNPAGLSSYYSSFLLSYNLKNNSWIYGLNLRGIGIFKDNFSTIFAISTSIRGFSLGISYNDNLKVLNPGILYRPFRFLSLGYYKDIYSVTLRPFSKSILEISFDAYYKDTFKLNLISAGLNLKSVLIYTNYNLINRNYMIGINLSFLK